MYAAVLDHIKALKNFIGTLLQRQRGIKAFWRKAFELLIPNYTMPKQHFSDLLDMMERGVERCPWVKAQTLESLKEEPVKEAIELREAIEEGNHKHIQEEMGDVIYDILLLAAVANRDGIVNIKEVLQSVFEKMKNRQPWLYEDMDVNTAEDAEKLWKERKKVEKGL